MIALAPSRAIVRLSASCPLRDAEKARVGCSRRGYRRRRSTCRAGRRSSSRKPPRLRRRRGACTFRRRQTQTPRRPRWAQSVRTTVGRMKSTTSPLPWGSANAQPSSRSRDGGRLMKMVSASPEMISRHESHGLEPVARHEASCTAVRTCETEVRGVVAFSESIVLCICVPSCARVGCHTEHSVCGARMSMTA